jgi:hypothetical protein
MNKAVGFAAAAAVVALGTGSAAWAAPAPPAAAPAPAPAAVAVAAPAPAPAQYIPKCATSDLAVWLNLPESQGAAGSVYTPLEFTNISGHECYLWAYPGVSAVTGVGGGARQLGDAAGRDSVYPARIVNLVPGATAHALLRYVDVITSDPGCGARDASYLRIYPEAQPTATYTYFDLPSCTRTGANWEYLTITTVQPGV